jgi:hypothetical protein
MNYRFTIKIPFLKSTTYSPIVFTDFEEEVPKFRLSFIGYQDEPRTFGSVRLKNDVLSHFKHCKFVWILISNIFNASFGSD